MAIHPFWAAHAVRQLEAEVADQLRYAGIVQDPRQRASQALPRACKQTCSALLLAAMSGAQSLTASLSASLILACGQHRHACLWQCAGGKGDPRPTVATFHCATGKSRPCFVGSRQG